MYENAQCCQTVSHVILKLHIEKSNKKAEKFEKTIFEKILMLELTKTNHSGLMKCTINVHKTDTPLVQKSGKNTKGTEMNNCKIRKCFENDWHDYILKY